MKWPVWIAGVIQVAIGLLMLIGSIAVVVDQGGWNSADVASKTWLGAAVVTLAVGLGRGALEESVRYAKDRRAFGQPIAEFEAIRWMLADIRTEARKVFPATDTASEETFIDI